MILNIPITIIALSPPIIYERQLSYIHIKENNVIYVQHVIHIEYIIFFYGTIKL